MGNVITNRVCKKGVCHYYPDKCTVRNGKATGSCQFVFHNGDKYTGDMVDSEPMGKGRMVYNSGGVCDGMWNRDKFTGKGSFIYKGKGQYEGDIVNHCRHGTGKFIDYLGNVLDGQWDHNKFTGWGSLKASSLTYTGNIVADCYEGEGSILFNNGNYFVGKFHDGYIQEGKFVFENGIIYHGKFSDKYLPEGKGIYTYPNGRTFKGIINGHRKVNGSLYDADGKIIEHGRYCNNELITGIKYIYEDNGVVHKFDANNNIIHDVNIITLSDKVKILTDMVHELQ